MNSTYQLKKCCLKSRTSLPIRPRRFKSLKPSKINWTSKMKIKKLLSWFWMLKSPIYVHLSILKTKSKKLKSSGRQFWKERRLSSNESEQFKYLKSSCKRLNTPIQYWKKRKHLWILNNKYSKHYTRKFCWTIQRWKKT
jgi:hypothetical protein